MILVKYMQRKNAKLIMSVNGNCQENGEILVTSYKLSVCIIYIYEITSFYIPSP